MQLRSQIKPILTCIYLTLHCALLLQVLSLSLEGGRSAAVVYRKAKVYRYFFSSYVGTFRKIDHRTLGFVTVYRVIIVP